MQHQQHNTDIEDPIKSDINTSTINSHNPDQESYLKIIDEFNHKILTSMDGLVSSSVLDQC